MKYKKSGNVYIVKIDKGESVIEKLMEFAENEEIVSGKISGIGAIFDPVLSYFDVSKKEYRTKEFHGEYEMASCLGNIALKDGEVFIHLHVVLSDGDFKTIGGHLNSAKISGAGEFFIIPTIEINRKYDDNVGLFIWDL